MSPPWIRAGPYAECCMLAGAPETAPDGTQTVRFRRAFRATERRVLIGLVTVDALVHAGFLEPPLAPPEVCAADQSLKRHARPTGPKLPKRCLERGVGLLPGAAQDEDRPVVRPADGEEILDPPALSELKHSLRPLMRALEIPHTFAGGDHVTAGASGCPQL